MIQQQKQFNLKLFSTQSLRTVTFTQNVKDQTAFLWTGERRRWRFHSLTHHQTNTESYPKVHIALVIIIIRDCFKYSCFSRVSFFFVYIHSHQTEPSLYTTRHKCHNPGFCNVICISLKYVAQALLLNIIIIAKQTIVM